MVQGDGQALALDPEGLGSDPDSDSYCLQDVWQVIYPQWVSVSYLQVEMVGLEGP